MTTIKALLGLMIHYMLLKDNDNNNIYKQGNVLESENKGLVVI